MNEIKNTQGATRTDRKMLELLVCPLTGGSLFYDAQAQELVSISARLAYKIRDGVPIMVAFEARSLDESEVDACLKRKHRKQEIEEWPAKNVKK